MNNLLKYLKTGILGLTIVVLGHNLTEVKATVKEVPKKNTRSDENKYRTNMLYINDGKVILRTSESDARIIASGSEARWSDKGKTILITSLNKVYK